MAHEQAKQFSELLEKDIDLQQKVQKADTTFDGEHRNTDTTDSALYPALLSYGNGGTVSQNYRNAAERSAGGFPVYAVH